MTQKIEKIQKKCKGLFESLGQSVLKFNDPEANSKQLTALLKR